MQEKNNSKNKILIKLLINLVISLVLFSVIFFVRYKVDHYIIDAFSLTGLLMLLFSALRFVVFEGVFNSVEWCLKKFSDMFRRVPKYGYKYRDFVAMKGEVKKPIIWPTIVVGSIYFIVGIIMIIVK